MMGSTQRDVLILNCRDNLRMAFLHILIFALFSLSTVALAAPPLVAVDVGHGLKDSGAISARGRSEFAFNRVFAEVLAGALRQRAVGVREVNFAGDIAVWPTGRRRRRAAIFSSPFITTRLANPICISGIGMAARPAIPT
jgi:hypothetical protein